MISNHDVLMAMQGPRAPKEPFVQLEEVVDLVNQLRLDEHTQNSDLPQEDDFRVAPLPEPEPWADHASGSSLPSLQNLLGGEEQLADILVHLRRVCAAEEALGRDRPSKADPLALLGDKDALHHAVLSLPARPDSMAQGSLYEPVRLVALIYEVGILFPLPLSGGALARVVIWMKAALEDTCIELIRGELAEAMLWIIFVAGVAAKGMAERDWFASNLQLLVKQQGITKWVDLKHLLMSFVWIPGAMDEGAMDLWDEVRGTGKW
jgi:hypothetical protein